MDLRKLAPVETDDTGEEVEICRAFLDCWLGSINVSRCGSRSWSFSPLRRAFLFIICFSHSAIWIFQVLRDVTWRPSTAPRLCSYCSQRCLLKREDNNYRRRRHQSTAVYESDYCRMVQLLFGETILPKERVSGDFQISLFGGRNRRSRACSRNF